jgi:uncharacterized repeat protein (TIGR03803 family)
MKYGWAAGASFGLLTAWAIAGLPARAATEQVLYSFPSGAAPYGRLESDGKGALYGIAASLHVRGAAFRFKQQNGAWSYNKLFNFGGTRGTDPLGGLVEDRLTGFFYGTTSGGGTLGGGTVYAFTHVKSGWTHFILHDFGGDDGSDPVAPLLRDKTTGNFYGTTYWGGFYGCGTVFQIMPSNGTWAFNQLYSFHHGSDSCNPYTQLHVRTKTGALIGGTLGGGINGYGTIFQLRQRRGVWWNTVIYGFSGGSDGSRPYDLDGSGDGTIYGVANGGGVYNHGVVFQLTANHQTWKYSLLYSFGGGGDGIGPAGINFNGRTGVLYGTTEAGGKWNMGTVFQLVNNAGTWKETVLHSFRGGSDGADPESRPIVDGTTGALYGTTVTGGTANGGTFYSVQP